MGRPRKIVDGAIELALLATARRLPKSAIKRMLRETYQLSPRSCESVFARVREIMVEQSGKPKEEHARDSYALYNSIVQDAGASLITKIRAQERIDRLLGLTAPERQEHSGPDGGPIPIQDSALDREDLDDLLKDAMERGVFGRDEPRNAGANDPGGA